MKTLRDKLQNSFPNINFEGVEVSCGDGWFDIISDAFVEMETLIDEKDVKIIPQQIKEKYATMRLYVTFDNISDKKLVENLYAIVYNAENKSKNCCEMCGSPNVHYMTESWKRNHCKGCRVKKKLRNI